MNMAYALGCAIAPILGGALGTKFGFRSTCDFMGAFAAVFGIVNFCMVYLPEFLC